MGLAQGLPGGIGGDDLGGVEVAVPLDREAKLTAHGFQFGNPHAAEFGATHAKIAEAQQQQKRSIDLVHKPVNSICYRQSLTYVIPLILLGRGRPV